jgi:hypothetical protein
MHGFPTEQVTRAVWKVAVGSDLNDLQLINSGVCSKHFLEDDYKVLRTPVRKGQLFSHAVPTLNIPIIDADRNND